MVAAADAAADAAAGGDARSYLIGHCLFSSGVAGGRFPTSQSGLSATVELILLLPRVYC